MLLGGTVVGSWSSPKEWEALLARSRFRAITAPFNCRMSAGEIEAYRDICARHGVVIAEIGVWKNLFDPESGEGRGGVGLCQGTACPGG